MNKNRILILVAAILFIIPSALSAQNDSLLHHKETRKKGWSLGALPVLAYDADQGFQFGALGQLYDYGDGTIYPDYRQTIYAEISFFTKGSTIFNLFYDAKTLLPGKIRFTADFLYLPEKTLDFYGFNGYQANYLTSLADQESPDYVSRIYYRMQRKFIRVSADFRGPIADTRLKWFAGFNLFNFDMATVNIDKINSGKSPDKHVPDTALLWDEYVKYGLISAGEAGGGLITLVKGGMIFDSRDVETAPNKGIWAEGLLLFYPSFAGSHEKSFLKLSLTYRQYISLIRKYLVFAYRLNYQGTIAGESPYYFDPIMLNTWAYNTKMDGLGGNRTLRGVMRDRVTAPGIALGNMELRWKFWRTQVWKQNLYLAAVGFLDAGITVKERPVDRSLVPETLQSRFFGDANDHLHLSTGMGVRIALNENFMVTLDYGIPLNQQDGKGGFYLTLSHMF